MSMLILLTAAVTPNAAFLGARTAYPLTIADPGVRAGQYRKALAAWVQIAASRDAKVAVVETSGASPDSLTAGLATSVTVVSYDPDADLLTHGKGAVEAAAIDHALGSLGLDDADTLYKVTGRLGVANAARIVRPLRTPLVRVRRSLDRRFVDTRFLGATVGSWRTVLSDMATEVDDDGGRMLEYVVGHRLIEAEWNDQVRVERFPRVPRFVGVSGTTGSDYGRWWDRALPEPAQRKMEGALKKLTMGRIV